MLHYRNMVDSLVIRDTRSVNLLNLRNPLNKYGKPSFVVDLINIQQELLNLHNPLNKYGKPSCSH